MIAAFCKDDALLASFAQEPAAAGEATIWWLGQSGFLVRSAGKRLLFDPYLSDSLTRKYEGSDKPHVRMTERVIAPDRLAGIDVVTSSHNHTDHLDAETLLALRAANPEMRFVFPEANRAFIRERLGAAMGESVGLDERETETLGGFRIQAVASAHNEVARDAQGRCHYLGYVIRGEGWTIYHSGDTLLYPGLAETLRGLGPIDLALLPINGNRPERRVAGNLDGREAVQLAREIGARWVIPCHYEMFEFNTADPADLFVPECERLAQPYRVLRAGESWRLPGRTPA